MVCRQLAERQQTPRPIGRSDSKRDDEYTTYTVGPSFGNEAWDKLAKIQREIYRNVKIVARCIRWQGASLSLK